MPQDQVSEKVDNGKPIFCAGTAEPDTARAGKVRFVASTGNSDRTNFVIEQSGWDFANYRKNPIVLFGHNADRLPVGKAVKVETEARGLVADVEFLPAGIDAFADKVAQLVEKGFLSAVSVGFRALERSRITDDEGRFIGWRFIRQELLEISIVPIPANAEALKVARSLDFQTEELQRLFVDGTGKPARLNMAKRRLVLLDCEPAAQANRHYRSV